MSSSFRSRGMTQLLFFELFSFDLLDCCWCFCCRAQSVSSQLLLHCAFLVVAVVKRQDKFYFDLSNAPFVKNCSFLFSHIVQRSNTFTSIEHRNVTRSLRICVFCFD